MSTHKQRSETKKNPAMRLVNLMSQISVNFGTLVLLFPAIFVFGHPSLTNKLRLVVLASTLILTAAYRFVRGVPLPHFKKLSKILLLIILAGILVSWGTHLMHPKNTYYLGLDPVYMGLISWFVVLGCGVVFADKFRQLIASGQLLIILSALLILSLAADTFSIRHGYRLSGLFESPDTLASIAYTALFLATRSKQSSWRVGAVLLSLITILLTQSIVGFSVAAIILTAQIAGQATGRQARLSAYAFIGILFALPLLFSSYFSALQRPSLQSITQPVSQLTSRSRASFSFSDVFYGDGPATLETDINNHNLVPGGIVKDMRVAPQPFGARNLFYDVYRFFGIIALLALLLLNVAALVHIVRNRQQMETVFGVYALLLINALLFPPSLYLTTLYFIALLALALKKPIKQVSLRTRPTMRLIGTGLFVMISVIVGVLVLGTTKHHTEKITSGSVTAGLSKSANSVLHGVIYSRVTSSNAPRGSGVLLDADTGTIMAMQDVLSDKPANCQQTFSCRNSKQQQSLAAWEPGSVIKPLLVAAALNERKVNLHDHFEDKVFVRVNDRAIYDASPHHDEDITVQEVLNLSRNTGAVHIFNQLGKQHKAREVWHSYLTQKFMFGTPTGLDQSEDAGYVRPTTGGKSLDTDFAVSSFGVGIRVTAVQLASAYAALVNGGVYHAPRLPSQPVSPGKRILDEVTSKQMVSSLKEVLSINNKAALHDGYSLGAKTGTAPAVGPDLAYKVGVDNGVYIGFIAHDSKKYVLVVRIDEPKGYEYASFAARDSWNEVVDQLIRQRLL